MKTRKIRTKGTSWVIFAIITFFPACRLAYYPTSYNAPVLQKQGDTQITGVIGLGNNEIQVAYATFDHVGLTLTGSYFAEKKEITIEDEVREITEHFTYLEGGVGYFDQIGSFGKYGIFGGAGLGRVPADFRNSFYDGNQTSLRKKLFLQPAIGFTSKLVDVNGVLRLSAVNINKETNLFAEPGVVLLMGYKNLKFYADAGLSLPYKHTGSLTWDHNFFIIGFGVQLNFNILGN
jgi:hypothetical protein